MMYSGYLRATASKPPHPMVQKLIGRLHSQAEVLDLGAGSGADVEILARSGFSITAVDREHESCEAVRTRCRGLRVAVLEASFENVYFPPESFDAVVSILALPFVDQDHYERVLRKLTAWVKPEGYIALSVFGPKDEWVQSGKVSFLSPKKISEALGAEVVELSESQKDQSPAAGGPSKHWHIVDIIMQKS